MVRSFARVAGWLLGQVLGWLGGGEALCSEGETVGEAVCLDGVRLSAWVADTWRSQKLG